MKLHDALINEDCIGQKITADIPVELEWVDYSDDLNGEILLSEGVEVEPKYRDVYVEEGLLAFCQGEICEIKAFNVKDETVTLVNNDPNRGLSTDGRNATEFTIPFEWYAACFGTGWAVSIDRGLMQNGNPPTLNLEMARRAHEANSFREFSGEKIQAGFNAEVSEAVNIGENQKQRLARLYPGVDLSEEYAKIDRLVSSFSGRLEAHYNKGFEIEASCPSIMIAGGSNFPARKKEKQNAARERHNAEYKEIKSIIDSIKAVGTSIRGKDENAAQKLQVKIAGLKDEQTHAKAMNAYYRKNGTIKGFDGVADDEAVRIDTEVKNAHSWARQPVPDYHLTSINNKIKEAERRLQELRPQTDLEIRLELEIKYNGDTGRTPLTLENMAEHQAKLDESKDSAYISGKVFAGDRHTKIGEWVYSKNAPDVGSWYCTDLKDAVSHGVSGGTVNKKIIADCWDAFLHGNTRSERQAERLDSSDTVGGGTLRLEEGRINIYFNGKPDADTINKLKSKAFKWSPSRMAWTRQDTANARFAVKDLIMSAVPETEKASVLDAIRADRENSRQPGEKTEKAKNRNDNER